MSSKKPLADDELARWEESRDLASELRQSIREMLAGQGKPVTISPVLAVRTKLGLSQGRFAELLGVSKRTLQEWEQGRRQPTGAARVLLKVAERHPEVLRELAA